MFYLSFGLVFLTGGHNMVEASIEHLTEFKCSSIVEYQWFINQKNPNRCINFVLNTSYLDFTQCFLTKLKDINYTVVLIDMNAVLSRNILNLNKTKCNDFMINYNSSDIIQQLFQKGTKIFFPYSYVFLISNIEPKNITENIFQFILENALNAYNININLANGHIEFRKIMNLLTGESSVNNSANLIEYFENFRKHPFLRNKNRRRKLRVSVFDCPPYVTYLTMSNGQDG